MHVVGMAKRRTYSATSPIRHRMKMYRLVAGNVSPELAIEFADMVNVEWASKYGVYRDMWKRAEKLFQEVPPGLRGLIRSGIFKCFKQVTTDGEEYLDECLSRYQAKTQLPPDIIDDMKRFIKSEIQRRETAPSKT